LNSHQKEKIGQLPNKIRKVNDDCSTIKQDPNNNKKESLEKKSGKKKSKFNIVNLLFNR